MNTLLPHRRLSPVVGPPIHVGTQVNPGRYRSPFSGSGGCGGCSGRRPSTSEAGATQWRSCAPLRRGGHPSAGPRHSPASPQREATARSASSWSAPSASRRGRCRRPDIRGSGHGDRGSRPPNARSRQSTDPHCPVCGHATAGPGPGRSRSVGAELGPQAVRPTATRRVGRLRGARPRDRLRVPGR
jgi:hypothetical protein